MNVESIYLHVQANNDTALDLYERLGFIRVGKVDNYYKRVKPSTAFILERRLHSAVHNGTIN